MVTCAGFLCVIAAMRMMFVLLFKYALKRDVPKSFMFPVWEGTLVCSCATSMRSGFWDMSHSSIWYIRLTVTWLWCMYCRTCSAGGIPCPLRFNIPRWGYAWRRFRMQLKICIVSDYKDHTISYIKTTAGHCWFGVSKQRRLRIASGI